MGTYKNVNQHKVRMNLTMKRFKELGWNYTKIALGCKATKKFNGKEVTVTAKCWRSLWSRIQAKELEFGK